MSTRGTRLRIPTLLLAALSALLIFAATASAETRTGEDAAQGTFGEPPAEASLVKASASYETTGGTLRIVATTKAEPQAQNEVAHLQALFFTPPSGCNLSALDAEFKAPTSPLAVLEAPYDEPVGIAVLAPSGAPTGAMKSVSGTTTTLLSTSPEFANQSFDCVYVSISEGETSGSFTLFPITAPPVIPPAPVPVAAPAPAPAPAALSLGKPKPLKLKIGKSKTVKIKVSNTGGTGTRPGSLKVKAPTGVLVRPGKQQIPALLPGGSFTLSVRVELTEKAKAKSTLSLTGTASGLTAKSSLIVKRTE
jgi:hypothetical protein